MAIAPGSKMATVYIGSVSKFQVKGWEKHKVWMANMVAVERLCVWVCVCMF